MIVQWDSVSTESQTKPGECACVKAICISNAYMTNHSCAQIFFFWSLSNKRLSFKLHLGREGVENRAIKIIRYLGVWNILPNMHTTVPTWRGSYFFKVHTIFHTFPRRLDQNLNPLTHTTTLLRRIFLHLIICTGWCLPSSLHSPVTWQHLGQWLRTLGAVAHVRVALRSENQYLLFSVSGLFKKEPEASMLDAVLWQRHCSSVRAGSTSRWCSSTTTAAVPMKWARTWRVLLVATLLRTSAGIWWRTPRPWHPARLTPPATCPPPVWASQWNSAALALQPRIHPVLPCHMGISVAAITRAECRITAA